MSINIYVHFRCRMCIIYIYNSCILLLKDHENITEKTTNDVVANHRSQVSPRDCGSKGAPFLERGLGGSSWSNGGRPPGKEALIRVTVIEM